MKKYLIFLIPLFLWGCEKTYDSVIEPTVTKYVVKDVSSFPGFTYTPGDTNIIASISLNNGANVSGAFFNIYTPDSKRLNNSSVSLYDDGKPEHGDVQQGDFIFSNKFSMSQDYVNGKYRIEYFVISDQGITNPAATHNFTYNNGQANKTPIVFNLSAPDTVDIGDTTTYILLSVAAADSNGLNDIDVVFFNSFIPPDFHPSQNNPFVLFDDGDPAHGDETAGDGVFSIIVMLPPTGVTTGTYRWEFQARDRGRKVSNIITHNILIR